MNRLCTLIISLVSLLSVVAVTSDPLQSEFYKRSAYDTTLGYEDRIAAFDKLLSIDKDNSVLIDKIDFMITEGRIREAMPMLDSIYQQKESLQADEHCKVLENLIRTTYFTGDYVLRYTLSKEFLEMPKPDSLRYKNFAAYLYLLEFSTETRDFPAEEKYYNLAMKKSETVKWPSERIKSTHLASLYGDHAQALSVQRRFDEAYRQMEKVLKLNLDTVTRTTTYISLGQIYEGEGKYSVARDFYQKALAPRFYYNNKYTALLLLAQRLLHDEGPEAAMALLDEYRDLFEKGSSKSNESSAFKIYAHIQAGLGDYRHAFELYQKADSLDNSVRMEQTKFMAQNSRRNIDLLDRMERDRSRAKTSVAIAVICLVVAVAALLVGWLAYRSRRRTEREKAAALEDVGRLEAERTKNLAEIENFRSELSRETLKTAEVVSAYSNARDAIRAISDRISDDTATSEKIDAIKGIVRDNDLRERLMQVDNVLRDIADPVLTATLRERFPTLTKAEIDMCLFIQRGYSSKQIAELTCRSRRTVDVVKYNLRKKLGIDIPTAEFLETLI